MYAFKWPVKRFTGGLLPDRAGFPILHNEIAPPHAQHLKGEPLSVYRGGIHEAAAARRSVGGQNRYLPNHIVDKMARHQIGIGPGVGLLANDGPQNNGRFY